VPEDELIDYESYYKPRSQQATGLGGGGGQGEGEGFYHPTKGLDGPLNEKVKCAYIYFLHVRIYTYTDVCSIYITYICSCIYVLRIYAHVCRYICIACI
jgi:hypothetical protein